MSSRLLSFIVALPLTLAAAFALAQDNPANNSWSSTSQSGDLQAGQNPTRTSETHSEANGRTTEKTSVQTLGPDGRYVPYSDREKESIRVDANTVRTIERVYGTGPEGQRTLIQQTQEETRTLPGGEKKVERTTSDPDVDGRLQVIRRELVDSKEVSAGVRDTSTTVLSADGSGGLAPSVKIEEREKQTGPRTTEFTKSTSLSNGTGGWNLSEVRQGTTRPDNGPGVTKEEDVMRPDADGKMAVVERKVCKQTGGSGESRETTETYSTQVPGEAGDNSLHLTQRETTVRQAAEGGAQRTTHRIETPTPGDSSTGLHLTGEAIDIVRPNGNGHAEQQSTTVSLDSDGHVNAVRIDMGATSNPSVVHVDTAAAAKPK